MTTLLDLPSVDLQTLEPGDTDVVVLGVPHGVPYPTPGLTAGCADGPAAIRARSQRLAKFVDHHDFDLDGPMIPAGARLRVVDAGDVSGIAEDGAGNVRRAEAAVRSVLAAGAVPILLGGDDSIPVPALRAFDAAAPLTVVQVDAHLDFRDEVAGVREGYSSPMRRAAEMAHVQRIVQVGLRGVGSARAADVADARAAGNLLVTARELGERGVVWLLDQVPRESSVFLAFDLDGLDPSIAPAVSGASPGGLGYWQAADLIQGLARDRRLAGAAFTELVPALDVDGRSALVVVRLLMQLLGSMARRPEQT
ncbi:MAG TPA: arginase family protein [Candidatus Limnocylindria bacterium]|jgi:agmatinase|nr:arginase family protein [Candidatus Limnocylindria bacterium]